jgi:hypothetical protein
VLERDPGTSPSVLNGDDVCLDLAVDRASAEPLGDSLRRDVGCFGKSRAIACLDFIP